MSQTEPNVAPADAARQQMQQLKADSSQQLAQLMLAQQQKLSQMVRQLQNQQQPAAASAEAALSDTADSTPALAGVMHLQQRNMGNLDLLLQRINTTMHSVLATPGPLRGESDGDKNGAVV